MQKMKNSVQCVFYFNVVVWLFSIQKKIIKQFDKVEGKRDQTAKEEKNGWKFRVNSEHSRWNPGANQFWKRKLCVAKILFEQILVFKVLNWKLKIGAKVS